MKKKNRNNKKGLKKRLSAVTLIYLDGLGNKKKARLEKYLDKKINGIVDYYFDLLKRKRREKFFLPPLVNEVGSTDLSGHENGSDNITAASEQSVNQQQDNIDKASEQNVNQQEDDIK